DHEREPMKRAVFFDCPTGAAGNMLLASLIDAGADRAMVETSLRKLPVKGWKLKLEKVRKLGVTGLHLVIEQGPQPERHLSEIIRIIKSAKLSRNVTGNALRIFSTLAKAEAKVHCTPVEKIHFHEVGAIDAIIDIVGVCLALEDLKVDEVHCSPLNVGHGRVKCAHGWMPVPAPATSLLLRNAKIYQNELSGELVTPTGAAILTALARSFRNMPEMTIHKVGHGAGTRDLEQPNMVRAFVGEIEERKEAEHGLVLLETNIDDMNPQIYEHVMERLFAAGAAEVWLAPVYMKKSRPGIVLSALVPITFEGQSVNIIMAETTSLGVRRRLVERFVMPRKAALVRTKYGAIKGKIAELPDGTKRFMPEYESGRTAAQKHDLPLRAVQEEAIRCARLLRS
ncbi:MAG: nickel pincer cofactor biosynthesis protein LarC, partial [Candidatus Edwardsbacteria bacterium]|nr:nickel pincer cofactor biosynthesis protein LarC [Candidatus Edwardsbacteria bacterium]